MNGEPVDVWNDPALGASFVAFVDMHTPPRGQASAFIVFSVPTRGGELTVRRVTLQRDGRNVLVGTSTA